MKNHFAAVCRHKQVKSTEEAEDLESDEVYQTEEISATKLDDSHLVTLRLESGNFIRFQPDTGAQCNVIPLHTYKKAPKDRQLKLVESLKKTLVVYGGAKIKVIG